MFFKKVTTAFILCILNNPLLAEETTLLPVIKIAANAFDLKPQQSNSTLDTQLSQFTLSKEDINNIAGTQGDPLKALTSLPGISIAHSSSGGGLNKGFYIRGSNTNENALWIDDLPVGSVFHLGGLYSVVNADALQQIDIYQGGFGVDYGDKLGGLINITTRAPNKNRIEQSLNLGTYESAYRIEGPVSENSSAYFSIRRSYFDLILPDSGSLGSRDVKYTQFPQYWDLHAKWRVAIEQGLLEFSLLSSHDQLDLLIDNKGDILKDPAIAGALGGETGFNTLAVKWSSGLPNQWQQVVRAGLLNTYSQRHIGKQLPTDPSPNEPYKKSMDSYSLFFLPKWKNNTLFNSELIAGIDAYQHQYKLDGYWYLPCEEGQADCNLTRSEKGVLNETMNGHEISPYINFETELTPKVLLNFGLRNTFFKLKDNTLTALSPRLNIEYEVNQDLILNAHWGKFIQLPEASQLSSNLGQPNLSYSEAEHRIIGLKHAINKQWSVQLEAYHKPMIKLTSTTASPIYYNNSANGEASGFEAMLKGGFDNGASGWISYAYSKSQRTDLNTTRPFDGDQPHSLNIAWQQPMQGSWSDWDFAIKLNAASGQPYTPIIEKQRVSSPNGGSYWQPVYGKTNSERLPYYLKLDLSMQKQWQYRGIELTTRFELINANALFRQNVVGYLYNSDYSEIDEVYDLPFMPSVSIQGTF